MRITDASRRGDEVEAKSLLDHGADVNARGYNQNTPLHYSEIEAIAKLLLSIPQSGCVWARERALLLAAHCRVHPALLDEDM